jgi:hypothetical protein
VSAWQAAVVLAWIAIVLLALGYAAVLREVRELAAGVRSGNRGGVRVTARSLQTGNVLGTLALAVTATCGSCRTVTDALAGYVPAWDGPDLRLVTADETVREWPSSGALRPLVDVALWDQLAIHTTPLLLRVSPGGTVVERSIVGSPEHLAELIERVVEGMRDGINHQGGKS